MRTRPPESGYTEKNQMSRSAKLKTGLLECPCYYRIFPLIGYSVVVLCLPSLTSTLD